MQGPAEQANTMYGYSQGQYGAPGPYGAMAFDPTMGAEKPAGGGFFGGSFGNGKGTFLPGRRRRLNAHPLFLCILAPWALFSVLYAVLSFSIHYETPLICWSVVMAGFVLVLVAGFMALSASGRWFSNAEREPTWMIFIFISMLLAFLAAYVLGTANYGTNMQKYYNMLNLNNYTDVSPAKMRGQQLMDAGIIEFAEGSKLDITKSMGFKNSNIYCVAPVSIGDDTLATYDFWVVGLNCCSSNKADYQCENYNNPHANGGLRLMSDNDRAFYRLAVQQAEATYGIKAVHPLFFHWTIEPAEMVDSWKQMGRSEYLVWMLSYGVFQTFLVAVAAMFFAKMGFN